MIFEDIKVIEVINTVDNGIVQFIQEINNLGYRTVMSCSGMKKDHQVAGKIPFICFGWPQLSGEGLLLFLRFISGCFYNSNWDLQYFSQYVVGYLPEGLTDTIIKKRFQRFISNLKIMEFFKYQKTSICVFH